jgi:hypothetical protein
MPRRYRFKGKSNLTSVFWCAAVDARLQIPHTTRSVLRKDVRTQFSQAECPQCSRSGQRKPRGCSGSESEMMPDLTLHAFKCSSRKHKYHNKIHC